MHGAQSAHVSPDTGQIYFSGDNPSQAAEWEAWDGSAALMKIGFSQKGQKERYV